MSAPVKILLVCLGNICRSPVAEVAMKRAAADAGLAAEIVSAGTGGYHVGEGADPRMVHAAKARGLDLSQHKARQADTGDFYVYDHIFAMDTSNEADLEDIRPPDGAASLALFLPDGADVPDPYYGGADGFDHVIDLVEAAATVRIGEIAGMR